MQDIENKFYNGFKADVVALDTDIEDIHKLKEITEKNFLKFIKKEIKYNNLQKVEDLNSNKFIECINYLKSENVIKDVIATKMKLEVSRLKRVALLRLFKQALGYK